MAKHKTNINFLMVNGNLFSFFFSSDITSDERTNVYKYFKNVYNTKKVETKKNIKVKKNKEKLLKFVSRLN